MIGIELATLLLEQLGVENEDVLVNGDNVGVIGAVAKGRSRNFQVNASIRRMETIEMARNIRIKPRYVNTKENKADPVSRGIPDPLLSRLQILFELPLELRPFLTLDA